MVNLSDIAAMGGQATAITDMIWAPDAASARPVLEGLKEGDWVVAAGVQMLRDGQKVKPVDRDNRTVKLIAAP